MLQIKIGNLMAILPLIGSLYVFMQLRPQILGVLSCIAKLGPGNEIHDRLSGIIAIAVITLGIVSAAKLVSSERKNDE